MTWEGGGEEGRGGMEEIFNISVKGEKLYMGGLGILLGDLITS